MPNPTATAASTDTAYKGGAVQDRRPLVSAARVNLSEPVRFVQAGGGTVHSGLIVKPGVSEPLDRFTGLTFSADCMEVEIDVLTGETIILPSYAASGVGSIRRDICNCLFEPT